MSDAVPSHVANGTEIRPVKGECSLPATEGKVVLDDKLQPDENSPVAARNVELSREDCEVILNLATHPKTTPAGWESVKIPVVADPLEKA